MYIYSIHICTNKPCSYIRILPKYITYYICIHKLALF